MNATRRTRRRRLLSAGARENRERNLSGARHAFTLLEILLALGLIALLSAVLVGGSIRMLDDKPVSTDAIFWKACAEARKAALQAGHDVRLGFADDREHGKRFTVDDGSGPKEFPVNPTTSGDLAVNFLSAQKTAGSAVIMAGQVVETQSLPFVTFYGDGTCTAFRVQIRVGVDSHILAIDPWTCAPVLSAEDKK
jgi:prepilin-type N-terminal cleavage/methylation domain-containing protein